MSMEVSHQAHYPRLAAKILHENCLMSLTEVSVLLQVQEADKKVNSLNISSQYLGSECNKVVLSTHGRSVLLTHLEEPKVKTLVKVE